LLGAAADWRKFVTHKLPRRVVIRFLRLLAVLLSLAAASAAGAQVRIKDIADVEGVRDNQLIGYGLVVGLNNTGDKLDNAAFTRESLIGMLERLGVNTRDQVLTLKTKNIAAVMVTAELPAFARSGSRIDVAVSALGDATNLTGGTLWSHHCLRRMARCTPSRRVRLPPVPFPHVVRRRQ
jgi:flagellar P-ring protein FlgI